MLMEMYTELQWLPKAPSDFSSQVKAWSEADGGAALCSLASSALDMNQLTRLAKSISAAVARGANLEPLQPFRLAVIGNATMDFILLALVASAARHGLALEIIQPAYDQVAQEALTPDSRVNASKPNAVLFALDYRALPLKPTPGDSVAAANAVTGAAGYLAALRASSRPLRPRRR